MGWRGGGGGGKRGSIWSFAKCTVGGYVVGSSQKYTKNQCIDKYVYWWTYSNPFEIGL